MATDAQVQQLSNELVSLTRTMRDMIDASSRTVAAQRANALSLMEQTEELEKFEKQLKGNRTLTKQQEKQLKDAIALKKQEQKLEREYLKARNESLKADKNHRMSDVEKQRLATVAIGAQRRLNAAQTATNAAAGQLNTAMGGLTKTTNLTSAALSWFGSTLAAQGKQLLAQNKANSGVVEGTGSLAMALFEQQNVALKYRMTGEEFAKVSTANRQMINAMGGSKVAFEQLDPTITRLQILTGDAGEAMKLSAEMATDFAKKGIRPTAATMEMYTNDLVQLQRQTGMNTRQAAEFYNEIASDADSIDTLRSARKEEREAILQSQRALVQQAIAAGMSAEQAKEAAKMLNKMTAAKPLDRLKQAAKVRALSGAMGIAGGDEAANAIIAGKRATAEQKQALAKFSENAANAMDQAAGQGLGSEIFATQLLDKLNLDEYYGKNSAFSTTLGDTMKPAFANLEKVYVNAANDWGAQQVNYLAKIYEQAKLILGGDHWGGVIASGIGVVVSYLAGGKLLSMLSSGIGKMMEGGKGILGNLGGKTATAAAGAGEAAGAATAGAGKAAGAATAGGGALSKLAKAGKIAGVAGAAVDVGMGINDLMQGKAQTEMPSGWDAISPMRWGMYAGDKVNKGAESLMGGQSIGSKLYDVFNGDDDIKKMLAPTPIKPKTDAAKIQAETAKKTAQASDDIKVATMASADRLAEQVKKLDSSNDFLKRIADMSEKQIDLAERQLVAMTMTDKERSDMTNKTALRKDSKFGAQYNYV
jgi:hypothetical protein